MPTTNQILSHPIPLPEECFAHFTHSLRRFGDAPSYQADGFNVRCSDLSLEKMVKLNGRRPFFCWIRTSIRFERNLVVPPESIEEGRPFDQLVLEYARRMTSQIFGGLGPGDFLSFVDPVEMKPERKANVVCRVLSGASLIEIQFWFGSDLSPF